MKEIIKTKIKAFNYSASHEIQLRPGSIFVKLLRSCPFI